MNGSGESSAPDTATEQGAGLQRLARSSRRFVLLAVVCAFAAGFASAVALLDLREAVAAGRGEDPRWLYVRELVQRYGLDARQERLLHMVLEEHETAHRRILRRDIERLPAAVRAEIASADLLTEERIQSVLTDEQLRRFLQDSKPGPLASAGPGTVPDDDRSSQEK